ncbi:response regulator [Deltaproteobacteria bacterium TL4]
MKLLVVDDEVDLLAEIAEDLTEQGHTVTTAENGKQAYALFSEKTQTFDGVLSDVRMPGMNGMELLTRIKQDDPETPVVLITGHGDVKIAIEALKLGALDFILKPFKLESLYAAISRMESLQYSKKELREILPFVAPIHLRIPSQTRLIKGISAYLQSQFQVLCHWYGLSLHEISVCLQEALINAIVHGNLEISSKLKEQAWEKFEMRVKKREASAKFGKRTVEICYQATSEHLTFEIEDQGKGFDYRRFPESSPTESLRFSGRGLILIRAFMDEVTWNEKGTRIKMVKYLKRVDKKKRLS